MKLFMLIPCYNHAQTVGKVLAGLPHTVNGFDTVATMVVDAGSTDGTAEAARAAGVDHVLRLPYPRGVVNACDEALHRCLALDADAIVLIDAEGLYAPDAIPALVAPIVAGRAELVVGDRGRLGRAGKSFVLPALYRLAVGAVWALSGARLPDPQCAFRALSREAAIRLSVGMQHTFAESVIRAGNLDLPTESVPVKTVGLPRTRPSALRFVLRAAGTMLRVFMSYQPFKAFAIPGALLCIGGVLIGARYLAAYLSDQAPGMVQSLILGSLLLTAGAFLILCGLLAELLSTNRALAEDVRFRLMNIQGRLGRLARRGGAAS